MEKEKKKAGRPPLHGEAVTNRIVGLTDAQDAYLRAISGGNRNEAVRLLISWHKGLIKKP